MQAWVSCGERSLHRSQISGSPPNHAWDPLRRPFEWSRNSMRIPLSMSSYLSRLDVCFALVFQMAGLLADPHSCRTFGIAISTLIELAQTHLPTRASTMFELLNNNL